MRANSEKERRPTRRPGRRTRAALVVAAVTLVGSAAACATLGRAVFREPVVNFRSIRLNGLGLTGG